MPAAPVLSIQQALVRYLQRVTDRAEAGLRPGLSWGYQALDEWTGGFRPGEITLVVGPAGIGKTTLALQVAVAVALAAERQAERGAEGQEPLTHGTAGAVVWSVQASTTRLVERLVCAEAGLSRRLARQGQLARQDWEAISDVMAWLARLPLWLHGSASGSPRTIHRRMAAWLGEGGPWQPSPSTRPELLVIDGLDEAGEPGGMGRRGGWSAVSHDLEVLARDLGLSVLVTCSAPAREGAPTEAATAGGPLDSLGELAEEAANVWQVSTTEGEAHWPASDRWMHLHLLRQTGGRPGLASLRWQPELGRLLEVEQGEGETGPATR